MDIHAASGDQGGLRDEQEDPAGKCRPVQMNDPAWQCRVKHSGKVVGARKAHKYGYQHEQCHCREKYMVVTAAWQANGRLRGSAQMCYDCGQCSSLSDWLDRGFLKA